MIAAADLTVQRPRTLKQALQLLRDASAENQPLTPMAGGTDLFVTLNMGQRPSARYLDLWAIEKLRGVEATGKRGLVFGALATYTDCIESKAVHKRLPILVDAARQVGGVQIQNRGTLAGNIENGSPAADGVPVLMAADATVVLRSIDGERRVPLAAYYHGYRKTERRADELIVAVEVEVPDGTQRFDKVGTRAAQAISKVVMAAVGHRLAFGSVAPTVVRARALEAYVEAGGRDVAEAQRLALEDARPIDDVRSTAEYRRRVVANLVAAWLGGLDKPPRTR
ncbi:MAG: molybdopterin dehydrogenase FAD-binding protein [Myxococcales bacterium]|nr:molybdopterin dehydrogenase FAD-binding protein [Myxococcales bacterium]